MTLFVNITSLDSFSTKIKGNRVVLIREQRSEVGRRRPEVRNGQMSEEGGHPSEIEKKEAFHGVKRSVTEIGENLRNLRMRIVKVLERSVELESF